MKKCKQHFLSLLFLTLSFNSFSQSKWASGNNGTIQVTTIKSPYCGSDNDVVLKLKNTNTKNVDARWWYQKYNGEWSDGRQINDMIPGKVYEVGACNSSGKYVMYVRESGSDEKFPNTQEMLKANGY